MAGLRGMMKMGGAILAVSLHFSAVTAHAQPAPMPRLVSEGGNHSLLVDGKPFIILGGQVSNSSNYPVALPKVWQIARDLNANTMEIPVAWEQVEPEEGKFDFAYVDQLLREARENRLRLVLLWFGTWKSGAGHYAPDWVKANPARFPRQIGKTGRPTSAFSPFGRATIEADKAAYTRFMRHLRDNDPQRTVIMVQVENEPGTLDGPRDFSPAAEAAFARPVPAGLVRALGKQAGSWKDVFAGDADRSFAAWSLSRAVEEIAAAGKAVYPLPTLLNAPGTNPNAPPPPIPFSSGGPDWAQLDIWKAMAPSIDVEAPNIYAQDTEAVSAILRAYARPNNPTMVPETGNGPLAARFFWLAMGSRTLGYAPFGVDMPPPPMAPIASGPAVHPLAAHFALFAPIVADWGALVAKYPTWGAAKGRDDSAKTTIMGRWTVKVEFGPRSYGLLMGPPPATVTTTSSPAFDLGGATVVHSGPNEFFVAGHQSRVTIGLTEPAANELGEYLTIEEGTFEQGQWKVARRWNGDQRDFGMSFHPGPALLRVKMNVVKR